MNTCEKWHWVVNHPAFGEYGATIHAEPQMVNPMTKEIGEDGNTEINWWLEVTYDEEQDFGLDSRIVPHHAYQVDTGGVTMEEAVDKLYELVKETYGSY